VPIQNEWEDNMISNMELTTDNEEDENYTLMFARQKKENFLTLNSKAQQEMEQVPSFSLRSTTSSAPITPPITSTNISPARETIPSTGTGTSRRASLDGLSATSSSENSQSVASTLDPG